MDHEAAARATEHAVEEACAAYATAVDRALAVRVAAMAAARTQYEDAVRPARAAYARALENRWTRDGR